jgi:hypothetical protein
MTPEEKSLLLQDLCARFPYGVKTIYKNIVMRVFVISTFLDNMCCLIWDSHKGYYNQTHAHIGQFKPYLRPMSSMTEEEEKQLQKIHQDFVADRKYNTYGCARADDGWASIEDMDTIIDFLNKHHFDYRGLIEKGLALEAPEGMYN